MAKKAALRLADLKSPDTQPSLPGTETVAATGGETQETEDMAKKPTMGAKKNWSFEISHGHEIPAVTRTGRRLPFNWDDMKIGSKFLVPKQFWVDFSGLEDAKAGDPARNKEAIRRNFYNWRDQEPAKRKKFALAFSDQYEGQKYTGVNVYLAEAA